MRKCAPTQAYFILYYNYRSDYMKTSKVYQVSDEEFKKIIANNYTYTDCLIELGLVPRGGSSTDILKRRIKELNCSTEHFHSNFSKKRNNKKIPLEDMMVQNATIKSMTSFKKRLIQENILEYKCAICGLIEWQNHPLVLQLEHMNGNNTDNRLENLRLLCPNCHSQTDTYTGKNAIRYNNKSNKNNNFCNNCGILLKTSNSQYCSICSKIKQRTVERPNRNELKQLIRTTPFTTIGKQYGVTDNAIRKWCKFNNLPFKTSEIKKISDEEWEKI